MPGTEAPMDCVRFPERVRFRVIAFSPVLLLFIVGLLLFSWYSHEDLSSSVHGGSQVSGSMGGWIFSLSERVLEFTWHTAAMFLSVLSLAVVRLTGPVSWGAVSGLRRAVMAVPALILVALLLSVLGRVLENPFLFLTLGMGLVFLVSWKSFLADLPNGAV